MRSKAVWSVLALLAVAVSLSGCIVVGKQLFMAAQEGNSGEEVLEDFTAPISGYRIVELRKFENVYTPTEEQDPIPEGVLEQIEPTLQTLLQEFELEEQLVYDEVRIASESAWLTEPGVFVIRGKIIGWEEGDPAGKTFGFWGAQELRAEVEYLDGASGKRLALWNITGMRKGHFGLEEYTVKGLAKGIGTVLEDRLEDEQEALEEAEN